MTVRVYAVPYGDEAEVEAMVERLRQEQRTRAVWVEDRLHGWVKAQPRMPTTAELEARRAELRAEYAAAGVDPDQTQAEDPGEDGSGSTVESEPKRVRKRGEKRGEAE